MTARIFFSLSALAANLLAASGTGASPANHQSRQYLLASVLPQVFLAADHSAPAPSLDIVTAQSAIAFHQFVPLWLVATFLAITVIVRRHQRVPLRC